MMEPVFSKDQDVTKALKSGTYRSRNFFFNPYTFRVDEIVYDLSKTGALITPVSLKLVSVLINSLIEWVPGKPLETFHGFPETAISSLLEGK